MDQIEQDLIITTALIKLFQDSALAEKLAFRGGTALNKLYFSPPQRYSEDIDLVQITSEPIGPTMTLIRNVMDSWLGKPKRDSSKGLVTLTYKTESQTGFPLKLKLEINTREHFTVMGYRDHSFSSSSRWFSGSAIIKTFSLEELLGTKLRALYQRRKGRDLFDLYVALTNKTEISTDDIVLCFIQYIKHSDQSISQQEFRSNLEKKMTFKEFRDDINILLAQQESPFDAYVAYELVTKELLEKL